MKRWPMVILVLLVVLGAVVPGCRHVESYDGRLVVADSLMRTNPDSALSLLEFLNYSPARGEVARSDGGGGAALATDGDRAYRDLLVTQARYKAYITATSDSDINRALAYFSAHPADREKLTRAYIYKGAVMDELGHPDSAMFYYKTAEATAAPDDYFNLGYIKMRIATLYQDQLSQDSAAISRLKQAITYFKMSNDTNYLIDCYGNMGAICGKNFPDSTEYYLTTAIELAQRANPSKQYTYKSILAGFNLYYKKDYKLANRLAMDVLNNGKADCDENQFYYYAVLSYIKLGLLDSAKYVFSITPAPEDKVDSMNYYNIKSEFDKIEKRPDLSAANALNSAVWENRIMSSSKEKKLLKLEHEFEKQQIKKDKAVLTKQNSLLLTFALIASAILILLFVLLKLLQSNYRKRLHELEMDRENLKSSLAELEHQKKTSTADVSKYVGYRISAINELYQAIRVRKQDDHSSKKTVIPLSALIKELNENSILLKLILKESFWEKLKLSVDGEYNGIVSFVEQRFTNLNENDVKLFCLLCANIPPQIIKLCMNYTNSKTSSTYRNRLIRKKMGLEMTFDDFIEKYMKGYFNC